MTARWYTVQLLPQLTETADHHLKRQGFTLFLPRIELARRRKAAEPVTELMFRGYGFVYLDVLQDQWLSVNGTRGVIGLLPRHAALPMPMREGLVELLQASDPVREEDFLDVFEAYYPGITEVEVIKSGHHLEGRRGVVTAVRSRLLEISFLVRNQLATTTNNSVWISRDDVSPIKAPRVPLKTSAQ